MPVYGVRHKFCRSISPTKLRAKIIGQNLMHLCAINRAVCKLKLVILFLQKNSGENVGETDLESIPPNFDFFIFPIFAFKLGHFKV